MGDSATPNCPFYGYQMVVPTRLHDVLPFCEFAPVRLMPTGGNQCALITGAHAPCQMETTGAIDWQTCPLVQGRLVIWKEG